MSYADLTFYKNTWKGTLSTDAEITKYLDRATDDINIMTNYSIDVSTLNTLQLELLKKSNCAQAENYIVNGESETMGDNIRIGSFSMSGGKQINANVSDKAFKYLDAAGLYYAGLSLCK